MLEMVLCGPEAVVAQVVHNFDHLLHSVEDCAQVVVIETTVIDCRRTETDIP